jgi:hypothetical protein
VKKELLSLLVLPILASGILLTSCNKDDNNTEQQTEEQTEQQFQEELDQALSWAQVYGPPTQTLAEEVAARHKGKTCPLNYKTRESTERKCRTDNSRPFELRDLARTTVICEYDSLRIVIDDVKTTATERGIFGRYKHQTSDRGYWGDLFNLSFRYLDTEIQVKSYKNYYAANPEDVCRPVLGDSLYNAIHTETGQEPGLSHYYYEIIRADTTSDATREYYKKLCIEYHSHFDPDFVE